MAKSQDSDKTRVDAFVPENLPKPKPEAPKQELIRANLAEDEDLCAKAATFFSSKFDHFKSQRSELTEILENADWMWRCGMNETRMETNRSDQDRQGDDLTKTKVQKIGSTLFHRQVKTLASLLADIAFSKDDPYTIKPRANDNLYASAEEYDDLANQHQMVLKWSRDQANFKVWFIDFLFQLLKYGNVPICTRWKRTYKEVLDRFPTEDGGSRLERRKVLADNYPVDEIIPPMNFYADHNIGNVQDQQAIVIQTSTDYSTLLAGARMNPPEYININKLTPADLYDGAANSEASDFYGEQQKNSGVDSSIDDIATGQMMQWDCYGLLPIDETKGKGKRWDSSRNEPKKYWCTFVGNGLDSAKCVKIERNIDPDDDYPCDMIHLMPDDSKSLYHMQLSQVLYSNFVEATTAKRQMIDSKTLNNNRPVIALVGNAQLRKGEAVFEKDKVNWCETADGIKELPQVNVIDNMQVLSALEQDSNDAAGTGRTIQGIPLGQRTSSAEAVRAYDAALAPHVMMAVYVLNQLFQRQARKFIRYWHVFADPNQTIRITDENQVYKEIRPVELWGDYDIEVDVVSDFQEDQLFMQRMTFAAQNLIQTFMPVLDLQKTGKLVFDKVFNMNTAKMFKPDMSEQSRVDARRENQLMFEGEYVAPSPTEDLTAMLTEHKGFRLQFNGFEDDPMYEGVITRLDRHIAETEEMAKLSQNVVGVPQGGEGAAGPEGVLGGEAAQLEAPPENQSVGEVEGNEIAAQLGAMQ
jgi:hypothetical protein